MSGVFCNTSALNSKDNPELFFKNFRKDQTVILNLFSFVEDSLASVCTVLLTAGKSL